MTTSDSSSSEFSASTLRGPVPTAIIIGICLPFILSGVAKLSNPGAAAGEVAGLGLPMPVLFAWLTIVVQLGGSLAAVFTHGRIAALGALALAGFTVVATLLAHAFWSAPEADKMAQTNIFFEHASITFGLIFVAWCKWRAAGEMHG